MRLRFPYWNYYVCYYVLSKGAMDEMREMVPNFIFHSEFVEKRARESWVSRNCYLPSGGRFVIFGRVRGTTKLYYYRSEKITKILKHARFSGDKSHMKAVFFLKFGRYFICVSHSLYLSNVSRGLIYVEGRVRDYKLI